MNKIKTLLVVLLLSFNPVFSQIVDLGNLSDYIFFASSGNITNTGIDTITGNIGSNAGSISLLGTTHTGIVHNQDSITAQAKLDLINLYQQLTCARNTDSTRLSAFGFDETLTPGVYTIYTAGSLGDTITLDGQGDTNALFIIKFAGAFTVAANSTVILTDSARACNVFWITDGACLIDTAATLVGTFISSGDSITMGKHGELTGRLLTMVGDIDFGPSNAQIPTKSTTAIAKCAGFYQVINLGSLANFVFFTLNGAIENTGAAVNSDVGIIYNNPTCITSITLNPNPLPINLLTFTGECLPNQIRLNWETASESNNDYFSIERSQDGTNWSEIGKMNGAGNSSSSRKYFLNDENQMNEVSYYQLKQHDFSGVTRSYSPISVQNCFSGNEALSIYPNPAKNAININFNGDVEHVINTSIIDLFGRKTYQSSIYQSAINTEDFEDGIYFLHLILKSGSITRKFLIAK